MSTGDFGNVDGDRKKKKIAIISVSFLILLAMVVAVTVGVKSTDPGAAASAADQTPGQSGDIATSSKAIQSICQPTDYRDTCEQTLTKAAGNTSDPKELVKAAFKVAVGELTEVIRNSTTLKELAKEPRTNQALENCKELLEYAIDDLNDSFEKLGSFEMTKLDEFIEDLKVWLSGAITYEQTCLDGFENTTGDAGEKMKKFLNTSQQLTSNGLAMVTEISSLLGALQIPGLSRRLLSDNLPSWVSEGQRRLLQAAPASIKPDVVVAKDGTGKFKTINEALLVIPKKSNKTFVIYVKEGVYAETVIVQKSMTHVMMYGDGPMKTIVTGNRNFVDGIQTFKTATFSAVGSNFFARDMGFENTAGPEKHQAVALRVQSDMSIFYNCKVSAFQDTLYAHAHRQFYSNCEISGTIDFIFGDAASVFQNCKVVVRKPMDNQQCIITAQGRKDAREPTGIVLQNCTITGDPAYMPFSKVNKAYLGRPWKEFSRTIIMQSQIDGFIQPEGWLPWMGSFGLDTLFYAEYGNRGPGAVQTSRVKWAGIKQLTPEQAAEFTPGVFIHGDSWIMPTGVAYSSGMMKV